MAQALDGLPDGLVRQSPWGQTLLEAHVGQQVQGPGAPRFAEPAWGLVEEALERIRLRLTEDRRPILGATLLLLQAPHAFLLEGVEGVMDGADGAPDGRGDPGGPVPLGAGQEDLRTPKGERLAAAESGLECPTLGVGQRPNEQRWFHGPLFGPGRRLPSNRMRLH